MELGYKPSFIKRMNKLEKGLQEEALEKIKLFEDASNHKALKVHKLNGNMKNFYSFSVNYKYRILFQYGKTKDEANLFDIDDHDIYN